jgi:hypothetical protein
LVLSPKVRKSEKSERQELEDLVRGHINKTLSGKTDRVLYLELIGLASKVSAGSLAEDPAVYEPTEAEYRAQGGCRRVKVPFGTERRVSRRGPCVDGRGFDF